MALWKGKKDSKEVFISLEISHWIFLENPLHISPEVRGQTVSLKAMVNYDSRKIAQNRTGVKRDFRLPFRTIFQTHDRNETTTYWGWLPPAKSCDCLPVR